MKDFYNIMTVPFTKIGLSMRARKDYGNISDLQSSIHSDGLLHPILVQHIPTDVKTATHQEDIDNMQSLLKQGYEYRVIAGGRRFTAMNNLYKKYPSMYASIVVHCLSKPYISEDYPAYERVENFYTKPMIHGEYLKNLAMFHRFMLEKKGEKRTSSEGGHSIQATADMLEKSRATVSKHLKTIRTAEHLNLDVEKMTSQKQIDNAINAAIKVAKGVVRKQEINNGTTSLDQFKQKILASYKVGNTLEMIKAVPDNSISFIECDPPYAIDLEHNQQANHLDDYHEWTPRKFVANMHALFRQFHRILKPGGWFICWHSSKHTFVLKQIIEGLSVTSATHLMLESGIVNFEYTHPDQFKVIDIAGLWTKPGGQTLQPSRQLCSTYEPYLYGYKMPDGSLNKQGTANSVIYNSVPAAHKIHRTQKPDRLYRELINTFCPIGETMLVPFLGSGQSIISAYQTHRIAYGFDLSKEYKNKFSILIQQQVTQLPS